MADKPTDSVPTWAGAGNYGASNYPPDLPWGDLNPLGGLPTPWSGQPRINAAGLVAFANSGLTPQIPSDASAFNAWLNFVGQWTNWVEDGSNAAGADAHIVETNAAGLLSAVALEVTISARGVGATALPLTEGATVAAGKLLTALGDIQLGDSAFDACIVVATTTFQSPIFATDDMEFSGSTTLSGLAGSVCSFPNIDATSGRFLAVLTEWTADVTPASDLGHEQWDGFRKSIGNGTSAQPIHASFERYEASDTANVALADIAGLSVTLTIPKDRLVLIELVVNQKVSLAGQSAKLEIRAVNDLGADPVARLKTGAPDAALSPLPVTVNANERHPNSIAIEWKPSDDIPAPVNDLWTIQAEHGVTGGALLTTTNANLRVTYR